MIDVSTSVVRAYLHINGYFTATDYPVVEASEESGSRMLTDLDILAVRFGRSNRRRSRRSSTVGGPLLSHTDPALRCVEDQTDMVVAEVKQGKAMVNAAARNPRVLAAVLARFGCCEPDEAKDSVRALLHRGEVRTADGHVIRMVLFASHGERAPAGWHWIHFDHVIRFLDEYLRSHRNELGRVDLRDPSLNWLALLQKCDLKLIQEKYHS